MGFLRSKKNDFTSTTTEYSPYSPGRPYFSKALNSGYSAIILAQDEKKDVKFKRRIRILRLTTRTISLILSGFMIGSLTYTLISYFNTRHHTLDDTTRIWGVQPKLLWPTYLILSISSLTFILHAATLIAYICGIGAANKTGDFTIYVGYFMLTVEVVVWSVSSGLYKVTDTGTDLWGYSCGKKADKEVLRKAKSFVDFRTLCSTQNGTWFTTIVQAILHLLTLVTLVLVYRRARGKKRVKTFRESQFVETGYTQNLQMESAYRSGKRYEPFSGPPRNF